ncbi:MAG: hypothetical protein KAU62_16645 [Candidatus Heimdallarchaeota archaeon]|nr:hypothetical protein [Candidatus Heimdallarchaeota archaeon]MCK4612786.1 hypothetical protein [Candidatus Heimdallarchaeota archaeon]
MKRSVKELLARLNFTRPEMNLTRILLVVLPLIVALIVSLASINLTYNNVIAANENYSDYVVIAAADNAVIEVLRTNEVNDADIYVVRAALGNTAVVDLVRLAAVDDMAEELTRISIVDGVEYFLVRVAKTTADLYVVR